MVLLQLLMCHVTHVPPQLDLPLSEAFYKWMLGQENTFTAQDLQVRKPSCCRRLGRRLPALEISACMS